MRETAVLHGLSLVSLFFCGCLICLRQSQPIALAALKLSADPVDLELVELHLPLPSALLYGFVCTLIKNITELLNQHRRPLLSVYATNTSTLVSVPWDLEI